MGNDGDDNWRYWPQQSMRTMYTIHYCCCCCWFHISCAVIGHYKSDIIQWKFIKLRTNNICIIIYASIHINPLLFNRENQVHTLSFQFRMHITKGTRITHVRKNWKERTKHKRKKRIFFTYSRYIIQSISISLDRLSHPMARKDHNFCWEEPS